MSSCLHIELMSRPRKPGVTGHLKVLEAKPSHPTPHPADCAFEITLLPAWKILLSSHFAVKTKLL